MKNKTKKIMAGLGIGLTLAGGGLVMTGCTDMLSQEQIDKILTVVDNSDKFMEESLDLLQANNKILNSSQALKLYEYSINRLHLNSGNVWDNLKITFNFSDDIIDSDTNNSIDTYYYYKLSSGVNVIYIKDSQNEIYTYHDSTEEAKKIEENGWTSVRSSFEYYAYSYCTGMSNGMFLQFSEKDIVSCTLMEDGNYKITLSSTNIMDLEIEAIVNMEVTSDGYLKSINYELLEAMPVPGTNGADRSNYCIANMYVKYEYGALTETEVQADIDAYNASQNA